MVAYICIDTGASLAGSRSVVMSTHYLLRDEQGKSTPACPDGQSDGAFAIMTVVVFGLD
jgi:hypothetical protein